MRYSFNVYTRFNLHSLFFGAFALVSFSMTASTVHGNPLANTKWQLVEFTSMDDAQGVTRPSDASLYTMHLKSDGSVALNLNCNRAMGIWSIQPGSNSESGSFTFGPLAGTRTLCPPPSMDESFLAHSSFVRSYLIQNGQLYLSLMADGGIYAWQPAEGHGFKNGVPNSGNDGGPLNWEVSGVTSKLNLRADRSTLSRVVGSYQLGTILDNYGCQRSEGRIWCSVQELGGGPVGYVAAEFLQPALSPSGAAIYGPDNSALKAGQGQFDATGSVPCSLANDKGPYMCQFGVARTGGGYATVIVTRPDGRERAIYFRMGRAIGASSSEADSYESFWVVRVADVYRISVGAERYEIPDAVVFGG